jgi:hypothetical protein
LENWDRRHQLITFEAYPRDEGPDYLYLKKSKAPRFRLVKCFVMIDVRSASDMSKVKDSLLRIKCTRIDGQTLLRTPIIIEMKNGEFVDRPTGNFSDILEHNVYRFNFSSFCDHDLILNNEDVIKVEFIDSQELDFEPTVVFQFAPI